MKLSDDIAHSVDGHFTRLVRRGKLHLVTVVEFWAADLILAVTTFYQNRNRYGIVSVCAGVVIVAVSAAHRSTTVEG